MLLLMTFNSISFVPQFAIVVVVVASAAAAGQKWLLAHATQTVRRHSVSLFLPPDDDVPLLGLLSINVFSSAILRQAVCLSELVWSGTDGRLFGGDGVS